jgi:hypothetical protein
MKRAGASLPDETDSGDPGIMVWLTQLPEATFYLSTSESANTAPSEFRNKVSEKGFRVGLAQAG